MYAGSVPVKRSRCLAQTLPVFGPNATDVWPKRSRCFIDTLQAMEMPGRFF